MMRDRTCRAAALAAVLGAALVCGCGPARKPVYPVRGKVLIDGQPAQGAIVMLHPVDEPDHDPDTPPLRPRAITAGDGSFELSTYTLDGGAPAGEYRVTILWLPELATNPNAPDKLGGRYADANTSGLQALIKADGPNELPPFELKQNKRRGPQTE
jgi:hypothetical protein